MAYQWSIVLPSHSLEPEQTVHDVATLVLLQECTERAHVQPEEHLVIVIVVLLIVPLISIIIGIIVCGHVTSWSINNGEIGLLLEFTELPETVQSAVSLSRLLQSQLNPLPVHRFNHSQELLRILLPSLHTNNPWFANQRETRQLQVSCVLNDCRTLPLGFNVVRVDPHPLWLVSSFGSLYFLRHSLIWGGI